jgi:hypothetical protein
MKRGHRKATPPPTSSTSLAPALGNPPLIHTSPSGQATFAVNPNPPQAGSPEHPHLRQYPPGQQPLPGPDAIADAAAQPPLNGTSSVALPPIAPAPGGPLPSVHQLAAQAGHQEDGDNTPRPEPAGQASEANGGDTEMTEGSPAGGFGGGFTAVNR